MPGSTLAFDTADSAPAAAPRGSSFWADTLHRVLGNRAAVAGAIVVLTFVVAALLAPNTVHWLGTDELGRDVLSRVLYGARITAQIQVAAVGLALGVGAALGLLAGYVGRWVDQLIMRVMDILMAFPGIFLALGIIAALGTGLGNVIIAAGIFLVPQFARVVRASVLTLKDMEFVQ